MNRLKKTPKPLSKTPSVRGGAFVGGRGDSLRYWAVFFVMAVAACVLFFRAYYLQINQRSFYLDKFEHYATKKQTIPVIRGMIMDTQGVPLAASAPLSTVVFSPYDYAKEYYKTKRQWQNARSEQGRQSFERKLAQMDLTHLAQASGYPLDELQRAVGLQEIDVSDEQAVQNALPTGAGSKRLVLLNAVTPEVALPVVQLNFVAVSEQKQSKRFYLQAEPTAQVLGYMASSEHDPTYKGRSGIELQYNHALTGNEGQVLVLQNAKNQGLKQLKTLKEANESAEVVLTIDSRLQYVLYRQLEQVGREQSARWASGIVVDVHTGDILAMASWPSFNSNNLSERVGANERNRVLLDVFEPGSVMKPFTVAAALESGRYHPNSVIATGGHIKVAGHTIRDGGNYGAITLAKLIQKSSNVGATKIALTLPADAIAVMQQRFGFGQKTGLNFPAEEAGRVDVPDEQALARRATLSYGYGQQVTLAQLAQAYATLGAGGVRHPLRLVKSEDQKPPVPVISEKNAKDIVAMMELVTVQGGTGKLAAIDGYRVAGKTGTARRSGAGGYIAGEYRTMFAGVAPASNPRFAVAILVEDPRVQFGGGSVAAPVFRQVMAEALRLYNVPQDKPIVANSTN